MLQTEFEYDATCQCTVYPKKYAHGFCFAVLCCGYTLTDFPISIRLTSLALWQSNDCPSASKATLMNMDKYFIMNDCITTTKQSTAKPCAYFLGYTVRSETLDGHSGISTLRVTSSYSNPRPHCASDFTMHNDNGNVLDSLTHWGWDKMAAIFQTTFSNAFSWIKKKFHWLLFPRVQFN